MEHHMFSAKDILIKQLTKEEILAIYTTHSVRHFPANERKPVSSIKRMADEGIYIGYGLVCRQNPGQLLGYAFFTVLPQGKTSLLDYFAVMENYRSHGIGSLFLQQIKTNPADYDGFLIESEDPDYAQDARELSVRSKRLSFYKKNGAVPAGLSAKVFGVSYRLLYFPIQATEIPSSDILCLDFGRIYRRMVSPENYEFHVHIFSSEDSR